MQRRNIIPRNIPDGQVPERLLTKTKSELTPLDRSNLHIHGVQILVNSLNKHENRHPRHQPQQNQTK